MSSATVFTPTPVVGPRARYNPMGVIRLRKEGAQLLHDWIMESPRIFLLVCTEPVMLNAHHHHHPRCCLTRDTSDNMDVATLAALETLARVIVHHVTGDE